VRDRRIGVIVTSERAVNQALLLRPLSDDIVVLGHDKCELDKAALQRFDSCGVPLVEGQIAAVESDGDCIRIIVEGREPVIRDVLFIQTELTLRNDLATQLGAKLAEEGSIAVDPAGATDVAGLRAAGDAALPPQAVAAALGCGTVAAYAINAELALEPFERGSPVADADPG
jgi:thioredoxin reductase